jgi:hypothetical protein
VGQRARAVPPRQRRRPCPLAQRHRLSAGTPEAIHRLPAPGHDHGRKSVSIAAKNLHDHETEDDNSKKRLELRR